MNKLFRNQQFVKKPFLTLILTSPLKFQPHFFFLNNISIFFIKLLSFFVSQWNNEKTRTIRKNCMSVQISNKEQRTSRQWEAGGSCLTKCQSRSHIMLLHSQRARTGVCVGTWGWYRGWSAEKAALSTAVFSSTPFSTAYKDYPFKHPQGKPNSVASPSYSPHPASTLFLITNMSNILFPTLRIYFMFSNFIKRTLSSKFPKSFSCEVKTGDNATRDLCTVISFSRLRYSSCNCIPSSQHHLVEVL